MCNVAVSEKGSTVSEARFTFARRAAADCDEFAECILIADFQVSRFTLVFQVLRLLADGAVGVKFVSRSGIRRSTKGDVMLEPAVLTEDDVGSDNAIRSDRCPCADFCLWIDNCGRVNLHVAHLSRNVNINSPSETTASFTTQ